MNARKFLLTYAQVPEGVTLESAVEQLQKKTPLKEYAISEERHAVGGRHFHALLVSDKKVDIRSARKFDLEFEEEFCPCNFQTIKNLATAVAYVCKDKEISNKFAMGF